MVEGIRLQSNCRPYLLHLLGLDSRDRQHQFDDLGECTRTGLNTAALQQGGPLICASVHGGLLFSNRRQLDLSKNFR